MKADFNSISLDDKKNYMTSLNISHYNTYIIGNGHQIYEIKISNDGLSVIVFKLNLGMLNQIVWV